MLFLFKVLGNVLIVHLENKIAIKRLSLDFVREIKQSGFREESAIVFEG